MRYQGRLLGLAVSATMLLLVGSCGATDRRPTVTSAAEASVETTKPPAETPPETTVAPVPEEPSSSAVSETTTMSAPAPEPVGPPAPGFTLDLGTGGTFVLSEQTTPVLIIFWAEW